MKEERGVYSLPMWFVQYVSLPKKYNRFFFLFNEPIGALIVHGVLIIKLHSEIRK